MDADSKEQGWMRIVLIAVIVLILLRFIPALWGGALVLIMIGVFGAVGYLIWKYFFAAKSEAVNTDEFASRIKGQMDICRQKANAYRAEAKEIATDHLTLTEQIARNEHSESAALQRATRMLAELDTERSLRLAKASFFEESHRQLREMFQSRQLQQEIQKGATKLEKWRQNNHLDVADMEEMRDRIERDRLQLDTISELTNRATLAPDLDHTEQLREKLKTLYG